MHTEQVYVLAGEGEMIIGEEKQMVRAGDYIHIPQGVRHGVFVKGEEPLKVLSVQSPRFTGKDRIFEEE